MKKKGYDQQKTDDLLRKLQAAVLSNSKKQEKKKDEPDQDELDFQKKIAGMLNRLTADTDPLDAPSGSSGKKKGPEKTTPAPKTEETPQEEKLPETETPLEGSVRVPVTEPGKSKKQEEKAVSVPEVPPETGTPAEEKIPEKEGSEGSAPETSGKVPRKKKTSARHSDLPDTAPEVSPEKGSVQTTGVSASDLTPSAEPEQTSVPERPGGSESETIALPDPVPEAFPAPSANTPASILTLTDGEPAPEPEEPNPAEQTVKSTTGGNIPEALLHLTVDPNKELEPSTEDAHVPIKERAEQTIPVPEIPQKASVSAQVATQAVSISGKTVRETPQKDDRSEKTEPERSSATAKKDPDVQSQRSHRLARPVPEQRREPVAASPKETQPAYPKTQVVRQNAPSGQRKVPVRRPDLERPTSTNAPERSTPIHLPERSAPESVPEKGLPAKSQESPVTVRLQERSAPSKMQERPILRKATEKPVVPPSATPAIPEVPFHTVAPSASDPSARSRSAISAGSIKISPRPEPPVSEQKENMQKNPQKIPDAGSGEHEERSAPRVRVIPDGSSASAPKAEPETIVIQPRTEKVAPDPIVIKPRQNSRTAEPVKVEPDRNSGEAPVKKISAPSLHAEENKNKDIPENPKTSPAPQHGRGISAGKVSLPRVQRSTPEKVSPAPDTESDDLPDIPAKKKFLGGVSLPRSRNDAASGKGTAPGAGLLHRQAAKKAERPTITPMPEEEGLDEALDDVISETAPVEELPVEEPEVLRTPAGKQSAFAKRKERKAKQDEEALNAISLIKQKTGLTEDDIALLFELGYENELGRLVGYDTLKRLKFEHIRKTRKTDRKHYRASFGYRGAEYTGEQPAESILANYAKDRRRLTFALVAAALLTLILFPLELPALFGNLTGSLSTAHPVLLPLVRMFILLICALLFRRRIDAGIRSLFRFTPNPYALNAVLVPLTLVYDIVALCLGTQSVPANLAAVCSLLLCGICDAFRITDEMRAFRIASAPAPKTVLDSAEPRKKKLRHGDKIVKIINDDVDQDLYRLRKTDQIAGFFRRCNDFSSASVPFMILICTMLGLALTGGIICAILSDSMTGALTGFITVLAFATPTSAVLLFFYPLCHANGIISKRGCTLIGEESVMEYSEHKTVIFNDSDMYTAQKCTQISVRDSEDFRRDMKLAGILFRKISGTLGNVGQTVPLKAQDDPPVAFVRLAENGTEALVDNRYHLLAGNAAFMIKNGVRVPKESTDRTARRLGNASLMYVAVDGALKLSYEIEYKVSGSFEKMARILAQTDTVTAIQTYDPNINEVFLQTSRPAGAGYIRVIKPGKYEQDGVLEVSDSGAVAGGKPFNIVYPLLAASAVRKFRSAGYRYVLLSILLGALLGCIAAANAEKLIPGMLLLFPLLYRFLCLAVTLIASHVRLRAQLTNHK